MAKKKQAPHSPNPAPSKAAEAAPSELNVPKQRQKGSKDQSRGDSSPSNRQPSPSNPQSSRQSSRQSSASKVSPRKVSEGLRQLPPNAYRFVRESYLLLDSDGSGSVSRETLRDMLASLGMQDPGDRRLNSMLERSGDPVTFAGYLSVVGELLADLPSQEEMDVMLEAFQTSDGKFDEKDMRSALLEEGLSAKEIDSVIARFAKPSRYGPVFEAKAFGSTMSI